MKRKSTALLAAAVITLTAVPATAEAAPRDPVRALTQVAHPLRTTEPGGSTADLRALGAMVGDAPVAGLGEATHGSHEFFAMKERVFRHLVEERGFTTFALELSWSAGLRIDEYLQTGAGDARTILKQELAGSPWDREEFVHLVEWMRDYNRRHPGRTVHFLGDDLGAPTLSDAFFGKVTAYVRENAPAKAARLDELYTGLRPLDDIVAYLGKPIAERKRLADRARQAFDLVDGVNGKNAEWAEQNARSIAKTTEFLTVDLTDPAGLAAMERFRDEEMARNVLWWRQHTGQKVLVSAHNDHTGYAAGNPALYPKTQGSFLRDRLGKDYVAIAMTFDRGAFLSKDTAIGGDWKRFTVPPAAPGSNEHTLDRVPYRDYYFDARTAPATARAWLGVARPTWNIGTQFPSEPEGIALARSFDVVVHLHEVRAAKAS